MEKKRFMALLGSLCLVFVWMVTLFVAAHAQPASKQAPIELKFAHYSPPGHPMVENVALPWIKMVEEKTRGKLKITLYPGQSLCKARDTYDAVVSGIADIGYGLSLFTPGRHVLTNVVTIPFSPWTVSSELVSQVEQKLYEEGKIAKEFADVKLLFLYTTPPSTLFTAKPVRSAEDAKGMKLGTPSPHTPEAVGLEAIGFTPVSVGTPDLYLAMQRGVVDATILTWESGGARKIHEVVGYATETRCSTVPFYYIMNLRKWNSLPPDVREAVESLSGMWGAKFAGKAVDGNDKKAKTEIVMPNLKEVVTLSPAERERWQKLAEKGKHWWITGVEKKGLPAREVFDAAVRITKEMK